MPTIEDQVTEVRKRHRLSGIHLFENDALGWTAFGSRREPTGIEASVESGRGDTIANAVKSLDVRLTAGPIHKPHDEFLDPPKRRS